MRISDWSSDVCSSDLAGRRGEPLVGVYCATKAAVISMTQSAGLDLIRYGINVNAIAPGVVDGEHWDGVDAHFATLEHRPLGAQKRIVGTSVPTGRMARAANLDGMVIVPATAEARKEERRAGKKWGRTSRYRC